MTSLGVHTGANTAEPTGVAGRVQGGVVERVEVIRVPVEHHACETSVAGTRSNPNGASKLVENAPELELLTKAAADLWLFCGC